jgi:putative ABC transport system permease protein
MDAEELLTFRVALPSFRYEDATDRREFSRDLLERLEGISGVRSVGMVNALPYSGSNWMSMYTLEERLGRGSKATVTIQNQVASENYLRTMQIPLLEGQFIQEEDTENQPEVGVVNESFARAFFPDGRAIGKRLKLGQEDSTNPWITIVGVAGDVMMSPTDHGPRPTLYRSYRQDSLGTGDFVMRVDGDPLAAAGLVREAVREVDPLQPIYNLRTVEKLISDQLTGFTYIASFMSIFGVLAVVLAMMGVYSIMAHSVAERIGEIGIRMALGAESREVLWMILRRGLVLTSMGLAIGVALSIPLGRLISGLIWGVSPNDPATFAGTIALFLGTAMVACVIPALRAARTDPVRVLRYE